jgi:hypothetical protein
MSLFCCVAAQLIAKQSQLIAKKTIETPNDGCPRDPGWNRPRDAGGDAKSLKNQYGSPVPHRTQEHQTKAMDKMEQYVSQQKIAHAERTGTRYSFRYRGNAVFLYFLLSY